MYYGLANQKEALVIANRVCDVVGHGANKMAVALLIETAQQETLLGLAKDAHPTKHGVGLCQFDKIGFDDVKQRTRKHVNEKIKKAFGFGVMDIQHRDLAYSPLLSMLWCRLFYMLIPDVIPDTVAGRAAYWKRYYNTVKGKGTPTEYISHQKRIPFVYL